MSTAEAIIRETMIPPPRERGCSVENQPVRSCEVTGPIAPKQSRLPQGEPGRLIIKKCNPRGTSMPLGELPNSGRRAGFPALSGRERQNMRGESALKFGSLGLREHGRQLGEAQCCLT